MTEDIEETAEQSIGGFSLSEAKEMYQTYKDYWHEIYREATIDLLMAVGDKPTQWGNGWDSNYKLPAAAVVVNELPQFIHQVCNDIRQNTPSIKAIPDYDADEETAEIYGELIRAIEYKSCADEVYDTAAEYQVTSSIGFIRVDHDYCDEEGDHQELFVKRVTDPFAIFIDPASIECDGRDMMGAVILEEISKKDFKLLYPDKNAVCFMEAKDSDKKKIITIAEIYIKEWIDARRKKAIVKRYKFSGEELLDETIFPSKYIPIVPVYGSETWIDGKRYLQSLIRQAREPQRRLNHWLSKESQILSMAPVAPVMAQVGTLVNDRGQWQNPASEMVLEYNAADIDGNPANKPERLAPPPIPTGIINAAQEAKEGIKESMGLYNASIGNRSNEVSGVAINARKVEGDVATFHFADNLRRAITQVGRILVDAIPHIYDTPRILQIITDEQTAKTVGVNGAEMQEGQERSFDLTRGNYHVRVTTGASYTTKRQEDADMYGQLIQANPQLLSVIGDLWAKSRGDEALANRLQKTIDPKLLDEETDPQVQAMQQTMQQMQEQLQQAMQALQSKQGEEAIKQAELQVKQGELQLKEAELKVKIIELQKPIPKEDNSLEANKLAFEQQIKEREIALKEAEFQLKVTEAMQAKLVSEQQLQNMQPLGQQTLGASSNQETMQFAG